MIKRHHHIQKHYATIDVLKEFGFKQYSKGVEERKFVPPLKSSGGKKVFLTEDGLITWS